MHSCGCTGLEDVRRIDVNEAVHIEKREKSLRNLLRSIVVADVRSGDHAGGREPVDVCKRNGGKSQRGTAILIIESGDGLIVIDAKGKRTTPFVFPMYEGGGSGSGLLPFIDSFGLRPPAGSWGRRES